MVYPEFTVIIRSCKKKINVIYRGVRDDIDQEDDQESFFRYMEENPLAGVVFDDDETVIEYDAEGNPIIPEKNKVSSHSASNFVL